MWNMMDKRLCGDEQDAATPWPAMGGASAADLAAAPAAVAPDHIAQAPGRTRPDAAQLQAMLAAAGHAPDHGRLLPWRFVLVPQEARAALAEVFAQALCERDSAATPSSRTGARKAFRARCCCCWRSMSWGRPDIVPAERLVSAGCAVQNLLLMATALGFGSALTSGKGAAVTGGCARCLRSGLASVPCFLSASARCSRASPRACARCRRSACPTLVPGVGLQPWMDKGRAWP